MFLSIEILIYLRSESYQKKNTHINICYEYLIVKNIKI